MSVMAKEDLINFNLNTCYVYYTRDVNHIMLNNVQ